MGAKENLVRLPLDLDTLSKLICTDLAYLCLQCSSDFFFLMSKTVKGLSFILMDMHVPDS